VADGELDAAGMAAFCAQRPFIQVEISRIAGVRPVVFERCKESLGAVKLLVSTGFAAEQSNAKSSHLYLPRRSAHNSL